MRVKGFRNINGDQRRNEDAWEINSFSLGDEVVAFNRFCFFLTSINDDVMGILGSLAATRKWASIIIIFSFLFFEWLFRRCFSSDNGGQEREEEMKIEFPVVELGKVLIALKWGAAGHTQIRERQGGKKKKHGRSLCLALVFYISHCVHFPVELFYFFFLFFLLSYSNLPIPSLFFVFIYFLFFKEKLTVISEVFYFWIHDGAWWWREPTTDDEPERNPSKRLLANQRLASALEILLVKYTVYTYLQKQWLNDEGAESKNKKRNKTTNTYI